MDVDAEQSRADNCIIRPLVNYTGPALKKWKD